MNEIVLMIAVVFGTGNDLNLATEILWERDSIDMYQTTDEQMLIHSETDHWSGSEDYRSNWAPKVACEMEYQP